jgi:hypothetical protein
VINALLSAEADAVCGAENGTSSPDRVNSRNGYRHRELDTRAGTIDVAIPKLRQGSYFPEWLLERRKRAEAALISVVATCYLLGVSTRRMDKLVQSLGITSLSKSQVSRMAAELDEQVTAFRTRPLADAGPFAFVAADALTMKVREHGRVVNAVVLVATGVNADGHREVLGVKVATSETKEAWNALFADLVARGLTGGPDGVLLVTSDAHAGLVEAIAANLPAGAGQGVHPPLMAGSREGSASRATKLSSHSGPRGKALKKLKAFNGGTASHAGRTTVTPSPGQRLGATSGVGSRRHAAAPRRECECNVVSCCGGRVGDRANAGGVGGEARGWCAHDARRRACGGGLVQDGLQRGQRPSTGRRGDP